MNIEPETKSPACAKQGKKQTQAGEWPGRKRRAGRGKAIAAGELQEASCAPPAARLPKVEPMREKTVRSFGGLLGSPINQSDDPVIGLDADRLAAAKPRQEFSVIDRLFAKGALGHAGVVAVPFNSLNDGLVRNHARQIDGQNPICQWAITHVLLNLFMGNIPT